MTYNKTNLISFQPNTKWCNYHCYCVYCGTLHEIKGIMNAPDYIDILKLSLLPSLHMFRVKPSYSVFMQDKHAAKIITKWFKDNRISILEWSSQAPDLISIENLWSI